MLQFSFSFLVYSLSPSFLITTIEEAAPHQTIAFFFLLAIILSSYLAFSSFIIGLILFSTGSLTLANVPIFHNILLVSFYFLS